MPATTYQSEMREQLVRLMGCSPHYYECSKKTFIQRLKWIYTYRYGNKERFIKIAKSLQKILDGRLKTKLVESHYHGPNLNIWVPGNETKETKGLFRILFDIDLGVDLSEEAQAGFGLQTIKGNLRDIIQQANEALRLLERFENKKRK